MDRESERARASQKKFYTLCCFLPSDIFEFSWNLLLTASPFDEVCEVSPHKLLSMLLLLLLLLGIVASLWSSAGSNCEWLQQQRQQQLLSLSFVALEAAAAASEAAAGKRKFQLCCKSGRA